MSWCRFGSHCRNTIPEFEVNAECKDCPGSSLYIYEGAKLTCCMCASDLEDFECDTAAEMFAHILAHDAAGHHVRRSLLHFAQTGKHPELTAEWKEIQAAWKGGGS